jgi:hypothetical protein
MQMRAARVRAARFFLPLRGDDRDARPVEAEGSRSSASKPLSASLITKLSRLPGVARMKSSFALRDVARKGLRDLLRG